MLFKVNVRGVQEVSVDAVVVEEGFEFFSFEAVFSVIAASFFSELDEVFL